MSEMDVELKHPRGNLKTCKVFYKFNDETDEYLAWIYMSEGNAMYAEHQFTSKGSWYIETFYEYPEIREGRRYISAGKICHIREINSLDDWKAWLEEYASELDPKDAFRYYKEASRNLED